MLFKIWRKVFGVEQSLVAKSSNMHTSTKEIPKKVWIYWAQGWENAPALIKLCRDSWIQNNPGWEIIQLTDANLAQYVHLDYSLKGKEVPHAAYSDIIRMHLLSHYGGVWVDATTFCSAPLDTWLPSAKQSGFFAFQKPKTTLASWFLAAEQGNALVRKWDDYVTCYWKYAHKPGRYFWLHYLFEYLIVRDPIARKMWQETPQVSSIGPYAARDCLKTAGSGTSQCLDLLFDPNVPVHKLDWKAQTPGGFFSNLRSRLDEVERSGISL
ncbi:MAG: capsular polysaccharide synthesis protein [Candidatus Saccharibacteria bacterium]|nr:capsular polysaccharide synthesis protein [Candidatus Saccharibacteria bacterium]